MGGLKPGGAMTPLHSICKYVGETAHKASFTSVFADYLCMRKQTATENALGK